MATTVLSQTMQKLMRDEFTKDMDANNLFTKTSARLQERLHVCYPANIDKMEWGTKYTDNKNNDDIIYLDFQKAFDTVSHARFHTDTELPVMCYSG